MPYPITVKINPDCLDFLSMHKPMSERQQSFSAYINALHNALNKVKKQDFYEFTAGNQAEISRGGLYAISKSLEQQFYQDKLNLETFQANLNKEFHIQEQHVIDFMTMCLVEPLCLPLGLSGVAYTILSNDYYCSNECAQVTTTDFKYSLKATAGKFEKSIIFNMTLLIYKVDSEKHLLGSSYIQFEIDSKKAVTLFPINMEFNFAEKHESAQFQQELTQTFQDWILPQHELDRIQLRHYDSWSSTDRWFFPSSIGLLIGLIGMLTLLVLSLTPVSPLLLPPLGLALGFLVASVFSSIACIIARDEQKKIKRPILFDPQTLVTPLSSSKPQQSTAFFNLARHDAKQALSQQQTTYRSQH